MQDIEGMGLLALGSRLKRASDLLFKQCDELYQAKGIQLHSRHFPMLQLLASQEMLSVTQLAALLSQTHPAISQISKKLEQQGWIYHDSDSEDERKRLLALTPKGFELVDKLTPIWENLDTVLKRILSSSGYGILENIQLIEREMGKFSIRERVELLEKQMKSENVEIIHFENQYAADFYRLNRNWLEKYFYVEALDHEILSQPKENIIEKGGFILLARLDEKIIGTAALIVAENNQLELSKMSVDDDYQGLGIGEKLARAAITQYRATDCSGLYLESNRKLTPALNLYRKLGFVEAPCPFDTSHYTRADIYMEYKESA
ncbi:bifunctional helix-turn-helix transcriptional regulator/GNAT family N-acetyltransferase [Aliikangiella sp. IMCC44653]